MYSSTNYMDSVTVDKLQGKYGSDFIRLISPWTFSTQSPVMSRSRGMILIGGGAATADRWIFNYNRPCAKLQAASTSGFDKLAAHGAGHIFIEGIDKAYNKVFENIELTGSNSSAETVYAYRSVNRALVSGYGEDWDLITSYPNIGVIDIGTGTNTSGSLQTVYASIDAGLANAYPRQYTLHNKETVYINCINSTVSNNASGIWSMWVSTIDGGYQDRGTQVFYSMPTRVCSVAFNNGEANMYFDEPYEVHPKSTIYFTLDDVDKTSKINIFTQGFSIDESIEQDYKNRRKGKRVDNHERLRRTMTKRLTKPKFYLQKKNLNRQ